MSTEFTFVDVARHNSRDDNYIVLWDKVYNVTPFLEEHPGGEEILIDVAGQDATEAFEEIRHTKNALSILEELLVGTLKRCPGDPLVDNDRKQSRKKTVAIARATPDDRTAGSGSSVTAIVVILVVFIAYLAHRYSRTRDGRADSSAYDVDGKPF